MKKMILLFLIILSNASFGQFPNELSNEEKIYGLSKFWQEVNYNFIYLNKIDQAEWNNLYKKYITEVENTKNDYEYYRILQKFCAFLKDGHTNVYPPKKIRKNILYTDFGDYKLILSKLEGKAIVTRINQSKKNEIPIGTEIIKVNGISTRKYLEEKVFPYISSSTDYIREDLGILRMLQGYVGTSFDLDLKLPNGKLKTLKLTLKKSENKVLYPPLEENNLLDFKWIDSTIAYVALNSFSDEKIDSLFIGKLPDLYKAKKLIIDLRYNGGGSTNIGREILKYLTYDTVLYGSKTLSRLHIPSFKAWGKWTEAKDTINNPWARQGYLSFRDEFYHHFPYEPDTVHLKSKRVVVPTVLLIGHNTASAAEDFLIYANNQKHMTKIGEPTFGSTGQPMIFDLPGGGSARVCTKKDTYPDGREFVGVGIQPDIEISKTLTDYIENKDPVLDRAIEFLKKQK